MNLTKIQIGKFWRAFTEAWSAYARTIDISPGDTKAREEFRKLIIHVTTGETSLTRVPRAGRKYANLMAALEQAAQNGIRWSVKVASGEADAAVPQYALGKFMQRHKLAERYVRGIAQRALRFQEPPELHKLDATQTETLLRILRAQFRDEEPGRSPPPDLLDDLRIMHPQFRDEETAA